MQSFKDFRVYHADLDADHFDSFEEFKLILQTNGTTSEVAANASPAFFIWIATSIGVAPPEKIRLFALWSALQIKELVVDSSCKRALDLCEVYLNCPFPEALKNDIDLSHKPSETIQYVDTIYDLSSQSRIIFDIAEHDHKQWWKSTATDDEACSSVHSAILTMSEAHCRECGFIQKFNPYGQPKKTTPAIADSDNLTVGIHINARLAAECAINAIREAAADSFCRDAYNNNNFDDYTDDFKKEIISKKAAVAALKAQADWLRQNIDFAFA